MLAAIQNSKNVIAAAAGSLLGLNAAKAGQELRVDEEHFVSALPTKVTVEDGR